MSTTLEQRIVAALETVSDAEPLYTERDDARVGRAGAYRLYVYPVRTIMGTQHRAVAHYQTSGMAVGQRIAGEAADITVDRGADGNPDVWIEIISDSGDFLAGDLTAQEAIRYLVRRNNDSRETA